MPYTPLPAVLLSLAVLAGCVAPGTGWRSDPALCRVVGFVAGTLTGVLVSEGNNDEARNRAAGGMLGAGVGVLLGHALCNPLLGELGVQISTSPQGGEAPLRVELRAVSRGATRFVWDLGDGTAAEGRSVEHVYRNAGTFYPTLTVSDDQGGRARAQTRVTVLEPRVR